MGLKNTVLRRIAGVHTHIHSRPELFRDTVPKPDVEAGVEDCSVFHEGQVFPPLNKVIHILIITEPSYIVFLDPDLSVHQWLTSEYPSDEPPADHGKVTIQESRLEAISDGILTPRQERIFRTMLGEAFARLLEEKNVTNAL